MQPPGLPKEDHLNRRTDGRTRVVGAHTRARGHRIPFAVVVSTAAAAAVFPFSAPLWPLSAAAAALLVPLSGPLDDSIVLTTLKELFSPPGDGGGGVGEDGDERPPDAAPAPVGCGGEPAAGAAASPSAAAIPAVVLFRKRSPPKRSDRLMTIERIARSS